MRGTNNFGDWRPTEGAAISAVDRRRERWDSYDLSEHGKFHTDEVWTRHAYIDQIDGATAVDYADWSGREKIWKPDGEGRERLVRAEVLKRVVDLFYGKRGYDIIPVVHELSQEMQSMKHLAVEAGEAPMADRFWHRFAVAAAVLAITKKAQKPGFYGQMFEELGRAELSESELLSKFLGRRELSHIMSSAAYPSQ